MFGKVFGRVAEGELCEDLRAAGYVGLCDAARRYSGDVGASSTFAVPWIRGVMVNGCRPRASAPGAGGAASLPASPCRSSRRRRRGPCRLG